MERLTKESKGDVLCNYENSDCDDSCMYGTCNWSKKAHERLKEYEDTGLTPEEIENLKDQSASDVAEVVHGEWLENDGRCYCNRCFEFSCTVTDDTGIIHNDLTKFCPNCGAKMDGGRKES